MLAFLKPWRTLHDLKDSCEDWKAAFERYMQMANQRDRDVVAGCQYYYDSRDGSNSSHVDREGGLDNNEEGWNVDEMEDGDDIETKAFMGGVSDVSYDLGIQSD